MNIQFIEEQLRIVAMDTDTNSEIGEIAFTMINDALVSFDHTFVSHGYRNQGIAQKMLDFAVDRMRRKNRKIMPRCPYVVAVFKRSNAYRDIDAS